MKKEPKRLMLSRETLRVLSHRETRKVVGDGPYPCTYKCDDATNPTDSCPDTSKYCNPSDDGAC